MDGKGGNGQAKATAAFGNTITTATANVNAAPVVNVDMPEAEQKTETKKEKYWDAPEVREIAQKLLHEDGTFSFPTNTPILYLFVDKMKDWGTCAHCSEKIRFAGGYEFIITMNHLTWSMMDDKCREALVFHELLHCKFIPETAKYGIHEHDVEEFTRVVRRYGLWREDVKQFVNVGLNTGNVDGKEN